MGPQHPSTHGVLRLILEIDGETVTEARCGIGYLHTGIEKNLEYRTWTQGTTFVTRMDYLTPFFNEAAYCLGVEKLLGIEDQIPDRATIIRVMLMELPPRSSTSTSTRATAPGTSRRAAASTHRRRGCERSRRPRSSSPHSAAELRRYGPLWTTRGAVGGVR
ncbi:NAD(P)H-quinone oxidoreductase subunit H, chloroplastic [Streptomyces tendae]